MSPASCLRGCLLACAFLVMAIGAPEAPLTQDTLEAQEILRRAGRRAVRTAENELNRALTEKVRGATRCALDDTQCAEDARREGERAVYVDDDGNIITDENGDPITDPEDAKAAVEGPGEEVWRNYDFVPGSEVVYALDLTDEPIGRFPASQLEFLRGNGQVVELNGEKVIEFSDRTTFNVHLPDSLPDDFTIEIGYQAAAPNSQLKVSVGYEDRGQIGSWDRDFVRLSRSAGIYRDGNSLSSVANLNHVSTEVVPFALQVDGDSQLPGENTDYAILYAGTERVAMVPNGKFERSNALQIQVQGNQRRRGYLTSLVVAVHGDPLYDALTTGERAFTTRGILFDFDSDRIRGASTPTLQEIQGVLEQYPDLTIVIEGHTDGLGEDDYNQELSERRAQAVVAYLAEQGIDQARMEAVGMGESNPVGDNTTEAGRQQNRRVVIRNASGS